jgi:hypothetical protein
MGMENVLCYIIGSVFGLILLFAIITRLLFKIEYYPDYKDRDNNLEPKIKKRYVKR